MADRICESNVQGREAEPVDASNKETIPQAAGPPEATPEQTVPRLKGEPPKAPEEPSRGPGALKALVKSLDRRLLYILIPVLAVGLLAAGMFLGPKLFPSLVNRTDGAQDVSGEELSPREKALANGGRIGYATEGVVATDPQTLQEMIDESRKQAQDPKNAISLQYKENAISEDGKNFDCFIGNSRRNAYDMFITIYADQQLTDELFLSELLRPGSRFEKIELERTLEPGVHTAYIVYTQVSEKEDPQSKDGEFIQVIHNQIATTINLIVEEDE